MIKIGGVQDKEAISKDRPVVGSVFNVNNKGKDIRRRRLSVEKRGNLMKVQQMTMTARMGMDCLY